MTSKNDIREIFLDRPAGTEITAYEILEITHGKLSYQALRELEDEGFLASRVVGREHRRRLYRLSSAVTPEMVAADIDSYLSRQQA